MCFSDYPFLGIYFKAWDPDKREAQQQPLHTGMFRWMMFIVFRKRRISRLLKIF